MSAALLGSAAALLLAPAAPAAPVRDCADSISGATVRRKDVTERYRFAVRPARDLVVGPVAFMGLKALRRDAAWQSMVDRDQWIKSIALVRRRRQVTLEVPAEQRPWMRLEYGHGKGVAAITLRGCPRRLAPFSGGFTIDDATAPRQGRCAELLVWRAGRDRPLRRRLFAGPARCGPQPGR